MLNPLLLLPAIPLRSKFHCHHCPVVLPAVCCSIMAASSKVVINPNSIPEEDRAHFNVLSNNVGDVFDISMQKLRECLTRKGTQCGSRRTTFSDPRNLVRLHITATEENNTHYSTDLLISHGDCYVYAFYASGKWRLVSDCPYMITGGVTVSFSCSYAGQNHLKHPKEIGPGTIYDSLSSLAGKVEDGWNHAMHHLCAIFCESARLIPVYDFIRQTLVNGQLKGLLYTHREPVDASLDVFIHNWGNLSREIQRFRLGTPPHRWKLVVGTANDLGLTEITDNDRKDPDKLQVAIRKQVEECESYVFILKHVDIGLLNE